MSYVDHITEEADQFEDRKVFHRGWSERNWRHLMKLYRYINRSRGLKSNQQRDSRCCFVPTSRKRKRDEQRRAAIMK